MNLKRRLKKILTETKTLVKYAKEAEEDIGKNKGGVAKKFLDKIIKLDTKEIKEINGCLKNLNYGDKEIIEILTELSSECNFILNIAKKLIKQFGDSEFIDENHKAELVKMLKNLESIGKKQLKLEEHFFKIKATDFEVFLEKNKINLPPPKKSKEKIKEVRDTYVKYNSMSDEELAIKFEELVKKIGPSKAEKYFKRIGFIMGKTSKVANKLRKKDPSNELIEEGSQPLRYKEEEFVPDIPKDYTIPFPKLGFPKGSDFAFLVTNGMLYSVFIASLSGGIWSSMFAFVTIGGASMGGLIGFALIVVTALMFIKGKATRWPKIFKKAMNLIWFIKQGGDVKKLYGSDDPAIQFGTVRI